MIHLTSNLGNARLYIPSSKSSHIDGHSFDLSMNDVCHSMNFSGTPHTAQAFGSFIPSNPSTLSKPSEAANSASTAINLKADSLRNDNSIADKSSSYNSSSDKLSDVNLQAGTYQAYGDIHPSVKDSTLTMRQSHNDATDLLIPSQNNDPANIQAKKQTKKQSKILAKKQAKKQSKNRVVNLDTAKGFSLGTSQVSSQSANQDVKEILTDKFSRELTYLRLSITDFCNFRCGYCLPNGYQGKRPDNELTLQEIEVLIQAFAQVGTQKVRLTGGEPSIRKDVTEIIERVKSTSGIETVAMTSNGYKLGKHISNWQRAGLDLLNISIDSFDPATFKSMTGFDILPSLLGDIDTLLETTDIKLKLNGILMESTAYDSLIAALDYVKTRPVTYRFIEFMQTSDNSDLFFAQHAQSERVTNYLLDNGWQVEQRGRTDGPAIEYSHPDYMGRIGMIAPYAAHFCDSCNRLRVSSLGKVHLCLFDQGNYDIRDYLQQQDIDGLIKVLKGFMPVKPEHHHLAESNSGIMNNLSMIGG